MFAQWIASTQQGSNFKFADFDVKASLLNKSEQKLKSSNLPHRPRDVHAALTRGCRLTKPQINAEGLHFSALVITVQFTIQHACR